MKTLHLTLKKKWFDMVGPDKPEEYRDSSDWIRSRLYDKEGRARDYDAVHFSNGYGKHVPQKTFEFKGFHFGIGKKEWGASGSHQYIIKLGERID